MCRKKQVKGSDGQPSTAPDEADFDEEEMFLRLDDVLLGGHDTKQTNTTAACTSSEALLHSTTRARLNNCCTVFAAGQDIDLDDSGSPKFQRALQPPSVLMVLDNPGVPTLTARLNPQTALASPAYSVAEGGEITDIGVGWVRSNRILQRCDRGDLWGAFSVLAWVVERRSVCYILEALKLRVLLEHALLMHAVSIQPYVSVVCLGCDAGNALR